MAESTWLWLAVLVVGMRSIPTEGSNKITVLVYSATGPRIATLIEKGCTWSTVIEWTIWNEDENAHSAVVKIRARARRRCWNRGGRRRGRCCWGACWCVLLSGRGGRHRGGRVIITITGVVPSVLVIIIAGVGPSVRITISRTSAEGLGGLNVKFNKYDQFTWK